MMTEEHPQEPTTPGPRARGRNPAAGTWQRLLASLRESPDDREWFVGMDLGGTGSRLRAVSSAGDVVETGDGPHCAALVHNADRDTSNAEDLVTGLAHWFVDEVRDRTGMFPPVVAAAVGLRGMHAMTSTGVLGPDVLHDVLAEELATRYTAVASDAVTAHLGALGGQDGIVLTVGTGVVAVSVDRYRRVRVSDGIGSNVGDVGGGAWIGEEGMRAAARRSYGAHETTSPVSPVLLEVAWQEFGAPFTWDGQLSGADRARLLAGFTPHVLEAAGRGDPAAQEIVDRAAEHLTDTVRAALAYHPEEEPVVAASGGLMHEESLVRHAVAEHLERVTGVVLQSGARRPVDGAVTLARQIVGGRPPVADAEWLTVATHYTDDNVVEMTARTREFGQDRGGAVPTRREY